MDLGVRRFLSKKEKKKLFEELKRIYPNISFSKSDEVEVFEEKNYPEIIIINGTPTFFRYENLWLPHLKYLLKTGDLFLPKIVIDMGAAKAMLRGADLMAPGIRRVEGVFKEGEPVVCVEEKYGKPVMVGIALVESEKIVSGEIKRGKVVKNIHYVGDKIWNLI
ncbi:MAG: DUF1947 domain-containing protein [Staphylothermus sp.]|nr:DUF1947 domain-containing protein [Staphylothermus sp.]